MRHPYLERLDQLSAGSCMPSTVDQDLRTFLELKLAAHRGRAGSAAQASAARSAATRAGIREALGTAPLTQPSRVLVGLVVRRYENRGRRPPARRTIADEVSRAQAQILGTSEPKCSAAAATVAHRSRRRRHDGEG